MQTVTELELDKILENLQILGGAELRQFRFDEKSLQIQFLKSEKLTWVCFVMKPGNPFLFSSTQRIHLVKNLKKPLALFLKTHFMGAQLLNFKRDTDLGRVVRMTFEGVPTETELIMSLIPGRVNLEARVGGKSVFAYKPSPFGFNKNSKTLDLKRSEQRNNDFFEKIWLEKFLVKISSKENSDSEKALKKKRAGLEKMHIKVRSQQDDQWAQLGDWLKSHQTLESVPEQWLDRVDFSKSLSWNIENSFAQLKKGKRKIEGTLKRIDQLELEIVQMESGKDLKPKKAANESLLKLADIKGKTLETPDGRVFIGKSGSENLKLLRKAKPWFFWMHIKDYPGAYGIMERNKGKEPSFQSLESAALAVVRQSLPQGTKGSFDVIYAECRYVRPIKGAKSGQVTYSHEKVIGIKVEE